MGQTKRGHEGAGRMKVVGNTAQSALVNSDRGEQIKDRLERLGISDREFYAKTGIDRKTLNRAIAGAAGVRGSTFMAIEAALDKLEAVMRGEPVAHAPSEDLVEFTIEGNFGVRAVVKGPVKDMDELQRAVARLVREMRGDEGSGQ